MTKTEYLEKLKNKLRVLSESELNDALEYYDGYISDAENEAEAIAQLGSPSEAAAMILAEHVTKKPAATATALDGGEAPAPKIGQSGVKTAWVVILAIFAAPIALPILITLVVLGFSMFIVLGSLVLSFGVTAFSFLVAGAASIVFFPFVLVQDFGYAMYLGGTGLVSIGLGIWFLRFTLYIAQKGFPALSLFVSKNILRRGKNDK